MKERDKQSVRHQKKEVVLIAGILFLITFAVNLAMPLFKDYADLGNYGLGMISLAFASYIAGLLPASVFLGGLSERLGKKAVLQLALGGSALSVFIMIVSPNIPGLFVARLLVGISVALGIATGSSYLVELFNREPEKQAANVVALSSTLGFGGGALASSVAIAYQKVLVPPTYWFCLVASLIWLLLSMRLPSIATNHQAALIRFPYFPKNSWPLNLSIALFWAVTGIVISIIPSQLHKFGLERWAGLSLFLINGCGAACLPLARRISERLSLKISYILLPVGLSLLVFGSLKGNLLLVLGGCALVGATSYGFGYLSTLSGISKLGASNKSRAVAGYLVFAYIGFGLPAVLLGRSADVWGIENPLLLYLMFTVLAIVFLFIRQRKWEKKPCMSASP